MRINGFVAGACSFVFAGSSLMASPAAESAWQEVLRLDAGPASPAPLRADSSAEQAGKNARERYANHLALQEKALRKYLSYSGEEAHAFDARFRLARVLALRSEVEGNQTLQQQAESLLDALEKLASREQKAHIVFTRLTQKMRINRFPNREQRLEMLGGAREFQKQFSSDPRGARLLVEVATQFDLDPSFKRSILEEASQITKEPQLRARIADDLKKIALFGKPLLQKFPMADGRQFDAGGFSGTPIVILFFSEESIPSLGAWEVLNESLRQYPKFKRLAVSLDLEKASVERLGTGFTKEWTISWDGKGWDGAHVRACGINAVPTAWLLNTKGRLISLNLLEDLAGQLEKAAAEAGMNE